MLSVEQEAQLKKLLGPMNIPDHRKSVFHPHNLEWLGKNTPLMNHNHKNFKAAMTIIYSGLPQKVTKKLAPLESFARVAVLLLMIIGLCAVEVPNWVITGIMMTETKSYYNEAGYPVYVDKRRGHSHERGITQVTPGAFKQVRHHGEQFWQVETDPVFCIAISERYLQWLYHRHGSWDRAVMEYNAGPGHTSYTYLQSVKNFGSDE